MTEPIIARLEHLKHRYGAVIALRDVTVDIPAQKMVGMIGPDGVGKSTLLALVSGVRRIQSGSVVEMGRTPCSFSATVERQPGKHRTSSFHSPYTVTPDGR
jgi:ABC-type branched-subunit amino acid transport system ATPase component